MASNTHIGELLKAEEEAVATVTAARKGEGPFAFKKQEKNLILPEPPNKRTNPNPPPFFFVGMYVCMYVCMSQTEKTDLLRQATAEADREVLAYRQQLEQQYQAMLQQGGADTKGNLVRLEQETGRTIESMKQRVQQKSQQVANILVDHVKRT